MPRADSRLPGPLPATLRPSFDGAARMLGLIPPGSPGETNLNNLAKILSTALKSAEIILRAFAAAEFDCFELRGLKQAGGFLTGDPLASSPYPKAFRVSTSEEFQPSRCGASKLARLNPRYQPCPSASSTFVLAIRNTTVTFLRMQGFFLPPIRNSRQPARCVHYPTFALLSMQQCLTHCTDAYHRRTLYNIASFCSQVKGERV